jgi:hypothetical protein
LFRGSLGAAQRGGGPEPRLDVIAVGDIYTEVLRIWKTAP